MDKFFKNLIARRFQKKGWKFIGRLPKRLRKSIIVTAPHTSYSDYLLWIAMMELARFEATFYIPEKEFRFPFSYLLKLANGKKYRSGEEAKLIEELGQKFADNKRFTAIVFAEKSMKRNDDLNDFFYDCAEKANVPLVCAAMDYERKIIKFHSHFYPNNNKKETLNFMKSFFATYQGKHPKKGVHRVRGGSI